MLKRRISTSPYDPIRDESGQVGGIFCIVSETTGRVLGERRLGMLRELGADLAAINTEDELFAAIRLPSGRSC